MDESNKEIHIMLHGPDREIIDAMKRRYGCSTSSAIRACIRIAGEVKLNLSGPPNQTD
jgi:hypothetical protein